MFPSGSVILKIDVKDYFMSRQQNLILAHIRKSLSHGQQSCEWQDAMADMVEHVLLHQFLRCREQLNRCWRAHVGSGMGLCFSGEISDAALFSMMEESFLLSPAVRTRFDIVLRFRFCDDMIICLRGDLSSMHSFFQKLQSRLSFFKMEV